MSRIKRHMRELCGGLILVAPPMIVMIVYGVPAWLAAVSVLWTLVAVAIEARNTSTSG